MPLPPRPVYDEKGLAGMMFGDSFAPLVSRPDLHPRPRYGRWVALVVLLLCMWRWL